MQKLFIASNNRNKIEEIRDILDRNGIRLELVCPNDYGCHEEPEENGLSFEENAYIKAKFYHDRFHLPTIADDSGISIDYFGGAPGIHSARFLPQFNYEEKCERIIEMMKDVKDRKARFIDCLCFIDEEGTVRYYRGVNEGSIAYQRAGNEGFGYDPIFVIPTYGKTEAELGQTYKNEHSHRAKALKEWISNEKERIS